MCTFPPRLRFIVILSLCVVSPLVSWAQEDDFLAHLSAEERAAIGLDELTTAQREALAAAVERYVAGRSEEAIAVATDEVRQEVAEELTAREEELAAKTEELAVAQAELDKQAEEVAAAKEDSLLKRAKVLLTPGTKIEYATIHAELAEPFKGWKSGTLFHLNNGQVWQVSKGVKSYWSPREPAGKAVTIEPGSFGSFFMRIEGVKSTPKVEIVSRN